MRTLPPGALLKTTQVVIYIMLLFIGIAAAAIAIASVTLPFAWTEVLDAIARKKPGTEVSGLLPVLYVIFALGLVALALGWTILRKLLAIVETLAEGDPFVHANALRLKAIGWMMVGAQVLGIPLYLAAVEVAKRFGKPDFDSDFSLTSLLAILLVFVLAGVFEQGAAMREEMEGTV